MKNKNTDQKMCGTITALSFKKVLCFRKAFYFIAVEV